MINTYRLLKLICLEAVVCLLLFLGRLGKIIAIQTCKICVISNGCRKHFSFKLYIYRIRKCFSGNYTTFTIYRPTLCANIFSTCLFSFVAFS